MKRIFAVLAFAVAFGLLLNGCDNSPLSSEGETESVATGSSTLPNVHDGDEVDRLCEAVPLDVVLVLDRSGSMTGSKMNNVKVASKQFVDRLTASDRAGLVSFANTASLDHALTDDFSAIKTEIDGLLAGGTTAIGSGVGEGHDEIGRNGRTDGTPVLVVLGNGGENQGTDPTGKAQAAKDDGIRVMTIAFGSGADHTLMEAMASEPKDKNFFVSGEDEIDDVFATITQELCPQEVDIDIKPGSDPNAILINNDGTIPVGVFTTEDFDATEINPETVRFGTLEQILTNGASIVHEGGHYEDLDDDGDMDFVGHFSTQDVEFDSDDEHGWLLGETEGGTTFFGHDTVRILDRGR